MKHEWTIGVFRNGHWMETGAVTPLARDGDKLVLCSGKDAVVWWVREGGVFRLMNMVRGFTPQEGDRYVFVRETRKRSSDDARKATGKSQ